MKIGLAKQQELIIFSLTIPLKIVVSSLINKRKFSQLKSKIQNLLSQNYSVGIFVHFFFFFPTEIAESA